MSSFLPFPGHVSPYYIWSNTKTFLYDRRPTFYFRSGLYSLGHSSEVRPGTFLYRRRMSSRHLSEPSTVVVLNDSLTYNPPTNFLTTNFLRRHNSGTLRPTYTTSVNDSTPSLSLTTICKSGSKRIANNLRTQTLKLS